MHPLTEQVILGVAAALKSAGFRSAEQYLAELRLGHIERKHEVPAWMERVFANCKRSLRRAIGPVRRAPELRLDQLRPEPELLQGRQPSDLLHPWACWVVAVHWMAREIEIAALTLGDVHVDAENGTATITFTASKTDQAAEGVRRQLSCTCGRPELRGACAVHVLVSHVARRRAAVPPDGACLSLPLFPSVAGGFCTRKDVAAGWQSLGRQGADKQALPTGHSARRSRAKLYARAGWSVPAIQFLAGGLLWLW